MENTIGIGDLVVATLAGVTGFTRDNTAAGTVVKVYGDPDNTMLVRLTGLVPAPYRAGMVLPLNGDKVRKGGW